MDNITTPLRPIVRVIYALQNAEDKIAFGTIEELEAARGLLKPAGCELHDRRLESLMGLLNIVCTEMNDIRQQLIGIARAEAKMKERPESA